MSLRGMEIPLDLSGEGGRWFAGFLLGLDRQTAFAAGTRFSRLLQNGGPQRVLDEVGRMYTGSAKGEYLLRLVKQVALSPEDLRRVFELAAGLNSDHSTCRVLLAAADRPVKYWMAPRIPPSSGFLWRSIPIPIAASVLMTFLRRALPTRDQLAAMLRSLAKVQSDDQKGRILIAARGEATAGRRAAGRVSGGRSVPSIRAGNGNGY